jgi:hypothetical protein
MNVYVVVFFGTIGVLSGSHNLFKVKFVVDY